MSTMTNWWQWKLPSIKKYENRMRNIKQLGSRLSEEEMTRKTNEIIATNKSPLIQIRDIRIKIQDVLTLEDTKWLNDMIINAYMNLINLRAEKNPKKYPKVYCFHSFLYQRLSKNGHNAVRRSTKKIDIFDFDIVIVPIHLKNHWCLIQISLSERFIKYYNSNGKPNNDCLDIMLQYLIEEYRDKKNGATFDTTDWQLVNVPSEEIPQQENDFDCGVFACTYAECITRNSSFSFEQKNIPYFRLKMKYEILTGELLL